MSRPLWSRALAAVLAIWLVVVLTGPAGLHACPVHGAAAQHGAAHPHAVAHRAPADHHAPHRPVCTCPGDCSGSSPVALAPGIVALAQRATPIGTQPASPAESPRPPAAPYLLPFANGPPDTRAA
jgi:hypothetical protein